MSSLTLDVLGCCAVLCNSPDESLPGVSRGDLSTRKTKPEIRSACVRFSPTGRAWAAATTQGLLVYSLDETLTFDPFELDEDVTPDAIKVALTRKEWSKAVLVRGWVGGGSSLLVCVV
mgnify:CR=1 FL=1